MLLDRIIAQVSANQKCKQNASCSLKIESVVSHRLVCAYIEVQLKLGKASQFSFL